jgi:asparagine synthetase B (glutamine-hydrolysing)
MTLFAGIYSLDGGPPPEATCAALRRALTRHPGDEVNAYGDRRCLLLSADIGAYGGKSVRVDADGSVSMLAGEPLLRGGSGDRTADLDLLHEGWLGGDLSALARARGVFCAVHYRPATGELSLVADKLCVRPVYYWADERLVVFANVLRVFEQLDVVPKQMDTRAVTEMVALGAPLGARTPYANVSQLRAAEVLSFEGRETRHAHYWRWDDIKTSSRPEAELAFEAYERFAEAVALRARGDTTTFAFLSGGLDSRVVVGALRARGLRVHTFNFSPAGSQDQIFGAEFARCIGTSHEEHPRVVDDGGPDWSQMLADAWAASDGRADEPAQRPLLAWSGDGGSVGLGHVHMSAEIVAHMRAGRAAEATDAYLRQEGAVTPRRFFKAEAAAALSDTLRRGILEELEDIHCEDGGRAFHLFLMLNDQRRHLFAHFEEIDRHRLELQLPFYDSDFLSLVLSVPVEECLGHRFYTKFLSHFPPAVTSVPWQTYPGHDPCPLPAPPGLGYQWDGSAPARRHLEVAADGFPDAIFSLSRLRLAALAHRLGLRDYDYLIDAVRTYQRYWTRCGGRYVLPHFGAAPEGAALVGRSHGEMREASRTAR